jgi:hypothetical protein
MRSVNRTLLAILVGLALVGAAALVGQALDLSSWAITGLAVAVGLLATLVDREGFYGSSRRRHAPRS